MVHDKLNNTKGLLLDLDGVLYVEDKPIEGAIEAVKELRERGVPMRFCTNTTVRSVRSLVEKLHRIGLPIEGDEVFSAVRAATAYLRSKGNPMCYLLVTDDPMEDFAEFEQDDQSPDYVVIGDLGKKWDHVMLQRIFEMIMGGAKMIALHKGRYWQTSEGLHIDIGAIVAGLEYATGAEAITIGKPSRSFFDLAVKDMGLQLNEAAMVGDDIDSDVGGAQRAGMTGVLVRTGKYRPHLAEESAVEPDLVIDSIADLPGLLT
jgi:HAD superfamily hydrolase (TIGR01458 family)